MAIISLYYKCKDTHINTYNPTTTFFSSSVSMKLLVISEFEFNIKKILTENIIAIKGLYFQIFTDGSKTDSSVDICIIF